MQGMGAGGKEGRVSVTYPVVVETVRGMIGRDEVRSVYRYLVNEFLAGDVVSRTFRDLLEDPALGLMPLVGVAFNLDEEKRGNTPHGAPW